MSSSRVRLSFHEQQTCSEAPSRRFDQQIWFGLQSQRAIALITSLKTMVQLRKAAATAPASGGGQGAKKKVQITRAWQRKLVARRLCVPLTSIAQLFSFPAVAEGWCLTGNVWKVRRSKPGT